MNTRLWATILLILALAASAHAFPVVSNGGCPISPPGTAGVYYSASFRAVTGFVPPLVWSIQGGGTVDGLTISSLGAPTYQGLLAGTPLAGGTFNFTIIATDALNNTGNVICSMTIYTSALKFNTTSLPGATQGQSPAYNAQVSVQGGALPYAFTLLGSLPQGLSLNSSTGVITGTPTGAVGVSRFGISVTDSSSPPQVITRNSPGYYIGVAPKRGTYGGTSSYTISGSVCHASGFFQTVKAGNRWLLADPNCGLAPLLTIQNAQYNLYTNYPNGGFGAHYGSGSGNTQAWANHVSKQVRQQYNFLGWGYYDTTKLYTGGTPQLPFILSINLGTDVLNHGKTQCGLTGGNDGTPAGTFKNLTSGLTRSVLTTIQANGPVWYMADFFDPAYSNPTTGCQQFEYNQAAALFSSPSMAADPFIIGVVPDDPGIAAPYLVGGNVPYLHVGMEVAITDENSIGGTGSSNSPPTASPTSSKAAWISYLQGKYVSVAALNAAWGTGGYYTGFSSSGGFSVVNSLTISSPGTGYQSGDVLPLYQKSGLPTGFNCTDSPMPAYTGCNATATVGTVNGTGGILTFFTISGGSGYVPGSVTIPNGSGHGTGAVLTIPSNGITHGTGVADEDGSHTGWMGTDLYGVSNDNPGTTCGVGTKATCGVAADLDAFLEQFTAQYMGVPRNYWKVTKSDPHLFFSFDTLGGGVVTTPYYRTAVLKGLKDSLVDVVYASYGPGTTAAPLAAYNVIGKPIVVWDGFSADSDSPYAGQCPQGARDYGTKDYGCTLVPPGGLGQPSRGAAYISDITSLFSAKGTDGNYPILGLDFWSLIDYPSHEDTNWGLVTANDNAYDGPCASIAGGTDAWSVPCGGGGTNETANYGDFLSYVTQGNLMAYSILIPSALTSSVVTGAITGGVIH